MREFNFILNEFKTKHNEIDNYDYMGKYINFLVNYDSDISIDVYSETHHILPRSTFPQYKDEPWNMVHLKYEEHKLVHLWLFKSINTRSYQKPLNFMMKEYKNSEELSNATKRGWLKLKLNEKKYSEWRKEKSESMKNISSEEQRRRANIFWNNITDEDYSIFCNKMRSYWTDENKIKKSDQMLVFYSNEENIEKKRIESKDRWDSLDDEYRAKFKEKMSVINKDELKRLDAGVKIKELWKNTEFLEKMRNRNKNPGTKIKVIINNGSEIIFENMKSLVDEHNFSAHLIRKYRDTGEKVLEKDLCQENIFLLGCIIETIKI